MAISRSSFVAFNVARLSSLKAFLGVETIRTQVFGTTFFEIRSKEEERLGSMNIKVGNWFYHVYSIEVNSKVRGKGLGRLLQVEAALFAYQAGIKFKFPSLFFLPEGRKKFALYPISTEILVASKLDSAFDKIGNS